MKFSEQMMLIAKGYSKKEIEELKRMEAEEQAEVPEEAHEEAPAVQEESKEVEAEPDYKKLYEDLQAKYEKTEQDLKDVQAKNIKENAAPAQEQKMQEHEDALANIARSFM